MKKEFVQYRKYYRESDPEYGQKVFMIGNPAANAGFYGFIYRRNDSFYTVNEKFNVTLTGLHFVGEQDDDFVEIESGKDNIIVFRNDDAFGQTSFGMSYSMKSRGMSDAEFVKKTME